jgi:hypothetical protein
VGTEEAAEVSVDIVEAALTVWDPAEGVIGMAACAAGVGRSNSCEL